MSNDQNNVAPVALPEVIAESQFELNNNLSSVAMIYAEIIGNSKYVRNGDHYVIDLKTAEVLTSKMLPSLVNAAAAYINLGYTSAGQAIASAATKTVEFLDLGRFETDLDLKALAAKAKSITASSFGDISPLNSQSLSQNSISGLLYAVVATDVKLIEGIKHIKHTNLYAFDSTSVEQAAQISLMNLPMVANHYLTLGHAEQALKMSYQTAKKLRHLSENAHGDAKTKIAAGHQGALKTMRTVAETIAARNVDSIARYGADFMLPVDYICLAMSRSLGSQPPETLLNLWNTAAETMLANGKAAALNEILNHGSSNCGEFESMRNNMNRRTMEQRRASSLPKMQHQK